MNNEYSEESERRKLSKIVPGEMKSLQFKFFKVIIMTVLITMVFVLIGFSGAIHIVLSTADLGSFAESQLKDAGYWIRWLFIGVMIVSMLIGCLLSFRLSHRIAGAIFRIESMLNEMLYTGKVFEIKIRKKDEFRSLVGILNKFIKEKVKN